MVKQEHLTKRVVTAPEVMKGKQIIYGIEIKKEDIMAVLLMFN